MTAGPVRRLQTLARDLQGTARAMLWSGVLAGCAALIGAVGTGFLLFAAFFALRDPLGSAIAALILGAALSLVSAGLILSARRQAGRARPLAREVQPAAASGPQPSCAPDLADQMAMAAFTAAFVFGRHLTDRDKA